jgi:hypothetical protein
MADHHGRNQSADAKLHQVRILSKARVFKNLQVALCTSAENDCHCISEILSVTNLDQCPSRRWLHQEFSSNAFVAGHQTSPNQFAA